MAVSSNLVLFSELLIDLCGTFAYGFIARELIRDRRLIGGHKALRWLAACAALWYLGSLADEIMAVLISGRPWFGSTLDVGRGLSWLAAFSLLVHAAWRMKREQATRPGSPSPLWLVPGYLSLAAFLPPAFAYWRSGSTQLAPFAGDLAIWISLHTSAMLGIATVILLRTYRITEDQTLKRFIRWFLLSLAVIVAVVGVTVQLPLTDTWRLMAQGAGLIPAIVLLIFVQRHTMLRLSVRLTTLRHFVNSVLVVVLIMAAGPFINAGDSDVYRRIVVWSVLLALFGGTAYSATAHAISRRSAALRRFIEPTVRVPELEDLLRSLRSIDLGRDVLQKLVTDRLSQWLGTGARFAEPGPLTDALRTHFERSDEPFCDLVTAPGPIAQQMAETHTHAAFALRIGDRVDDILLIESGVAGGGVRSGEYEMIELALGQLATVIELQDASRARLEAERNSAERERLGTLGMVAASLAHELKNPLSSMKALAQTVHEELQASEQEEQATDLAAIIEQIDSLDQVTREILGFARPAPGDAADLPASVGSAVYILGAEARRRGVVIETDVAPDIGPVHGSPASWQSVIFNLLLNAVRHAPDGSVVSARLFQDTHSRVVFETSNGGPAIDSEVAAHIFEPFVSDGGTGLGLHVVARRAQELGATIKLSNEPDTITFSLTVEPRED